MENDFRQIKSLVPYQLGDGCIRYNLDNRLYNCFRFMIISPLLQKFFNSKAEDRTLVYRV